MAYRDFHCLKRPDIQGCASQFGDLMDSEQIIRRSTDPGKRLLASVEAWRNRLMQPRDRFTGHLLYNFRYRDPLTRKWTTARYKAERHVIAETYREWELIGPPEIRRGDDWAAGFNPLRRFDAGAPLNGPKGQG